MVKKFLDKVNHVSVKFKHGKFFFKCDCAQALVTMTYVQNKVV